VASVLASLFFGLAPALHVLRVNVNVSLKQNTTRATGGGMADRMRGALVVAEIALSMILLVGAGLLLKSFAALQDVTLGFRPDHVLLMEASVPSSDLEGARRATRFYQELVAQVALMPGVASVAATRTPPGQEGSDGGYWIDHLPKELDVTAPQAVFSIVSPREFATLGIPVLRGRDFNDRDIDGAPMVAVISEKLANDAFPGQDPLEHSIYCGMDSMEPMRIVGVVGNVREYGPAQAPAAEIYMPYLQHPLPSTDMSLVVRTPLESPGTLIESIRQAIHTLSPDVPVKASTLNASVSENVAAPRFRTMLIAVFAGLALSLALAGVYGVMSYIVGQRSNEIGLRMALGATSGDMLRLVLRRTLLLAGIGIVIGLVGSVEVTQLLTSMLFGVKATDPATYAIVIVLLIAAALLASWVPARRAMRVDPMVAIRYE
jgi:putative ABC transport system permease protein